MSKLIPLNLRRARVADIVGLRVRLTRDLTTRGGETFKKGRVMKILNRHGGFTLGTLSGGRWVEIPGGGGGTRAMWGVRGVERHAFEVIGW